MAFAIMRFLAFLSRVPLLDKYMIAFNNWNLKKFLAIGLEGRPADFSLQRRPVTDKINEIKSEAELAGEFHPNPVRPPTFAQKHKGKSLLVVLFLIWYYRHK